MAKSERERLARIASREADKQRLYNVLTSPGVMGLATLLGGIYAANAIPWSEDEGRKATLRSIALAGTTIGALSMMGVKDRWVLGGFAAVAGVAGADGGGTAYSPLQAGEATLVGASLGSILPGIGTLAGGGIGLGIDSIYQMVK